MNRLWLIRGTGPNGGAVTLNLRALDLPAATKLAERRRVTVRDVVLVDEREVPPIAAAELAIGRVLRMGSRPFQPGDVEEYERCRRLVIEGLGDPEQPGEYAPNYARDRLRGAAGDNS